MDKKDFLQFEKDDTSKTSVDGKQVFVTKRINGKITHNKEPHKEKEIGQVLNNDEIIIGLNRIPDKNQNGKENNQINRKSKKKKLHKNKKEKQKNKKTKTSNSKKIKTKTSNSKNKKIKKILKIFAIIILLIGTIIFALTSPIFNIKEIEVEGNEKISKETVVSLSDIKEETNIFRNSKSIIENKIKTNPYIDKVEIKRSLPDVLKIKIEERKIAYQIKVIDSYIFLDYQGYILEKSAQPEKVPIIEGFNTTTDELLKNTRISDNDIQRLNTILKIVDNAKSLKIYDLITNINIENNEYIIYFKSKKKHAYLGDGTDITNKMLYVSEILNKEDGNSGKIFINGNLNAGFKPYFREE